ncbi:MAG: kelch repeat-containing protein [Vicinamibacterales bacterium]|jgi:hypothetical protein
MTSHSRALKFFLAALIVAVASSALLASPFVAAGTLTVDRIGPTITALADGKYLVAGGVSQPVGILATAEIYDPITQTSTPTGSMHEGRIYHVAARLADGRVLIAGGANSTGPLATAEIFDPATGIFTTTAAPMAGQRLGATANLLLDGRVLVAGGNDGTPDGSAELFNPATGTFVSVANTMSELRILHSSARLADGTVLLSGGFGLGYYGGADLFDPATSTFVTVGSMSTARINHTITPLPDGRAVIIGGDSNGMVEGVQSSVEVFDPATRTFALAGALLEARTAHAAALVGNEIMVLGGAGVAGSLSSVESFAVGRASILLGDMLEPRNGHAAFALPNNSILVIGGGGAGAAARTIEILPPPPTADAGPDQLLFTDGLNPAAVTLTGLGSIPDGSPLTYRWTSNGAFVSDQAIAQVQVGLGDMQFTLTVTDPRNGRSVSDTVRVVATPASPGTVGPAGPQGPAGVAGPQGPAGPQGATGPQGPAGTAGPAGPAGPAGSAGPAGAQGPQGLQGLAGAQGFQGLQGPVGPMGPAGTGVAFTTQSIAGSGVVTLPEGSRSVIVMVTNGASRGRDDDRDDQRPGPQAVVTLPAASSADGRMIVVRRMDNRGRVSVRPPSGAIVGWRQRDAVTLERRFDQVTLVSDGSAWVVLDAGSLR